MGTDPSATTPSTGDGPLLVTGATGFLGRALLARLESDRSPGVVRALVRDRNRAHLPTSIESVVGDLEDPSTLGPAVAGVSTIVHAAALHAASDDAMRRVNVDGTRALASAARRAAVRRFVVVSTSSVYGSGAGANARVESDPPLPRSAYGASKLAAEQAAAAALGDAGQLVVLRPTRLYGPGRELYARLLRSLASRRWRWVLPGTELVQPCYIDDAVTAIVRCLDPARPIGEPILNLAGRDLVDVVELERRLAALAGIPSRTVRLPVPLARLAVGLRLALIRADADAARVWRARARGETVATPIDTTRAERELALSWTPLDRGLRETVDWWRATQAVGGCGDAR